MSARVQRQAAITALVIGIGLAVAPAIFQMFDRAPKGGDMIDEFEPYMTSAKIDTFAGYLDLIDAANSETIALRDEMVAQGSISAEEYDTTYAGASALNGQWATIDEDMGDLIARMDRNLDNYEAVAALPPFPLFPWFFFLPGLMIAAIARLELPLPGPGNWKARALTEVRQSDGRQWRAQLEGTPTTLTTDTRRLSYRLRLLGGPLPIPGTSLEVKVPHERAIYLPQAALQQVDGHWGAFVAGQGEAVFRPVRRGLDMKDEVLVLEGLKPGETVVAEGAYLLKAFRQKRAQPEEGGGHGH